MTISVLAMVPEDALSSSSIALASYSGIETLETHEGAATSPPPRSSIRMVFRNVKVLSSILTSKSCKDMMSGSWALDKGLDDGAERGVSVAGGTAPGAALDVTLVMARLRHT